MRFTKMQGTGNDFVVIETGDTRKDWAPLAVSMCDRHFGIGADGLLLVMPSRSADIRMRIVNADGSEAEACGNGLRCLVRYITDRGLVRVGAGGIRIETMGGIREARLQRSGGSLTGIKVSMGKPEFAAQKIPVNVESGRGQKLDIIIDYPVAVDGEKLLLSFVSMGNPHAVHFQQQLVAGYPLAKLGPKVEHHKIFPNRVNFEVARLIDRREIEARVWERGVGETLACGSGICAIAVLARMHGYIDDKVDIRVPGGILGVEWDGKGEVFLSGPAETVFTGEWNKEV